MQPPNGCSARRKKIIIIIIKNSSHGISFIVRASGLPGVCAPLSTSAQRKKEKKNTTLFWTFFISVSYKDLLQHFVDAQTYPRPNLSATAQVSQC